MFDRAPARNLRTVPGPSLHVAPSAVKVALRGGGEQVEQMQQGSATPLSNVWQGWINARPAATQRARHPDTANLQLDAAVLNARFQDLAGPLAE